MAQKYINAFFEIPFRVFEIRFRRPKIEFVLFTVALYGDRSACAVTDRACAVTDRAWAVTDRACAVTDQPVR